MASTVYAMYLQSLIQQQAAARDAQAQQAQRDAAAFDQMSRVQEFAFKQQQADFDRRYKIAELYGKTAAQMGEAPPQLGNAALDEIAGLGQKEQQGKQEQEAYLVGLRQKPKWAEIGIKQEAEGRKQKELDSLIISRLARAGVDTAQAKTILAILKGKEAKSAADVATALPQAEADVGKTKAQTVALYARANLDNARAARERLREDVTGQQKATTLYRWIDGIKGLQLNSMEREIENHPSGARKKAVADSIRSIVASYLAGNITGQKATEDLALVYVQNPRILGPWNAAHSPFENSLMDEEDSAGAPTPDSGASPELSPEDMQLLESVLNLGR